MIIRCAWCKTITGDKPPYGGKYDDEVTDGMCPACEIKYFGKETNDGRQKQSGEEKKVPHKGTDKPGVTTPD